MNDSMRALLRRAALRALKTSGVFQLAKNSAWRGQRLLILCYHGVALEDENLWRPFLYVDPQLLARRLEILHRGNYRVLALGEAIERLFRRDLPPKSVALTFDDGTYDFYKLAYPLVKQFGFPVTVYLTTYYSNLQRPIFGLACSYLLWKARKSGVVGLTEFGINKPVDLRSGPARQAAERQLVEWADGLEITGEQKDQIAARLAEHLGVDHQELVSKRILQLMNEKEVKELAGEGVDFQLHTHRHRAPLNEALFQREIRENRAHILKATGHSAQHFCYPSGAYRPEFFPWLADEGIISATTCDTGIATPQSNRLLLQRLVDSSGRNDLEFEGWASGVSHFISSRKRAPLAYLAD